MRQNVKLFSEVYYDAFVLIFTDVINSERLVSELWYNSILSKWPAGYSKLKTHYQIFLPKLLSRVEMTIFVSCRVAKLWDNVPGPLYLDTGCQKHTSSFSHWKQTNIYIIILHYNLFHTLLHKILVFTFHKNILLTSWFGASLTNLTSASWSKLEGN